MRPLLVLRDGQRDAGSPSRCATTLGAATLRDRLALRQQGPSVVQSRARPERMAATESASSPASRTDAGASAARRSGQDSPKAARPAGWPHSLPFEQQALRPSSRARTATSVVRMRSTGRLQMRPCRPSTSGGLLAPRPSEATLRGALEARRRHGDSPRRSAPHRQHTSGDPYPGGHGGDSREHHRRPYVQPWPVPARVASSSARWARRMVASASV